MPQTVFNRKCKGSLTEKADATTEIVIQGDWLRALIILSLSSPTNSDCFDIKEIASPDYHCSCSNSIGPKNRVDSFIRWVKRGPGLSQIVRVDNIEYQTELSADILASPSQFQENIITARR